MVDSAILVVDVRRRQAADEFAGHHPQGAVVLLERVRRELGVRGEEVELLEISATTDAGVLLEMVFLLFELEDARRRWGRRQGGGGEQTLGGGRHPDQRAGAEWAAAQRRHAAADRGLHGSGTTATPRCL